MAKDFQITDKPSKKLNCIYKRMSKKSTSEDFQYIKNRLKEADSPVNEVNNLLQNSDRIYNRDMKRANYGLWAFLIFIFATCVIVVIVDGMETLYGHGFRVVTTLMICVAAMMGIKSTVKSIYECNTSCLKRIRVELEKENKK